MPQPLPAVNGAGMTQMLPFIPPEQIAQNQADMLQWQQRQALAQQLMGAQYEPDSGKVGLGGTILTKLMGALAQRGQNEKLADILKSQFEIENQAASAKRQQDLQDEYRKLQEDIYKTREGKKAEREFAPLQFQASGAFDPSTGTYTPSEAAAQQQIGIKTAEAQAAARAQASVAGAGESAKLAQIQRIMGMPDSPQKTAMLSSLLGEGGMQALAFSGMTGGGGQGGALPTSGEDYLKSLSPQIAAQVKAIGEYRQAPLTSMAMRSPMGAALMQAVNQAYPDYDATAYPTRSKARADFTSGAGGKNINAANTAIEHAGQLLDAADALGNYGGLLTPLNAPKNAVAGFFGAPAPKEFAQNREALAGELTKAFRGASGSEKDIEEMRNNISAAGSPEQLHAAVGKAMQLLASKVSSLKEQYDSAMGPSAPNFYSPKAQAALAKMAKAGVDTGDLGGDIGADTSIPAQAAPTMTATGPNGQKIGLVNGQWVPL